MRVPRARVEEGVLASKCQGPLTGRADRQSHCGNCVTSLTEGVLRSYKQELSFRSRVSLAGCFAESSPTSPTQTVPELLASDIHTLPSTQRMSHPSTPRRGRGMEDARSSMIDSAARARSPSPRRGVVVGPDSFGACGVTLGARRVLTSSLRACFAHAQASVSAAASSRTRTHTSHARSPQPPLTCSVSAPCASAATIAAHRRRGGLCPFRGACVSAGPMEGGEWACWVCSLRG